MSTNIEQLLPEYYNGIRETRELMQVEGGLFEDLSKEMRVAVDDQFILTCSREVLSFWEKILNIRYDPTTETTAFRRERIINRLSTTQNFTLRWLRQRLDHLIGREFYELRMDYDNYTMYIESSIENQLMYHEMILTVYKAIPANIRFRLVPVSHEAVEIEVQGFVTEAVFKRAGVWMVGVTPFLEKGEFEEVQLHAF